MANSNLIPTNPSGQPAKDDPSAKHDPFASLRVANYRLYAAGFVCSSTGLQIMSTALAWEIWDRTHDAFLLGLAGLARALPVILLTLPAGSIVDRTDRKRVLAITQFGFALVALLLAFTSFQEAPLAMTYMLLLLSGCVRSFNAPSRGALLPSLLPEGGFENAIAWQSGFFQFAAISGPLLAGGIIWWTDSTAICYLVTSVACVVFGTTALFLKPRPVAPRKNAPGLRGMVEGAEFIWKEKTILGALVLDLLAVLFGGATALLPIYADEILHVDAVGLGALRAAPYIGALAMAGWLTMRKGFNNAGRALLWSVVGFGICMIVFGLSTSFWLSMVVLAISGALDNISVVVRHVLIQMRTPDGLRGRTTAVNSVFIECSNEVGSFESGLVAQWLGPVVSATSGGVGTLMIAGLVAWMFPDLRRLGRLTDTAQDVVAAEEAAEPHRGLGTEGQ
ncbi:MAG: MFS transporter [Phycisphaerales bacterium]|nr:MFS transporter [Phycisphaerales bacterium]